ncbi:MAG: TolC family protein [Planctomycetota bacterium]
MPLRYRIAAFAFAIAASTALFATVGCRTGRDGFVAKSDPAAAAAATLSGVQVASHYQSETGPELSPADGPVGGVSPPSGPDGNRAEPGALRLRRLPPPPEEISPADRPQTLGGGEASPRIDGPSVEQVIVSVVDHFPVIREAVAARVIASGERLSAEGAFDRKVEGMSNVQPMDFYENHWYRLKMERDTYWGGKVGAGYKLGRGSFEPWFLERETNDGGELSLTVQAPIVRDRLIDQNRSDLWQAQVEQRRIEPLVRSAVIGAVRDGVVSYWLWVAAGAKLEVANNVLRLGEDRVQVIRELSGAGRLPGIDNDDNRRIIVDRLNRQIDARRKLEQAAAKLSLFTRAPNGVPILPTGEPVIADFPDVAEVDADLLIGDIDLALTTRPELEDLSLQRRQLNIALQQAANETWPDLDGGLFFGQDVGNPVASRTKSEFELEATLMLSVPLERRKALGKVRQVRGKIAQVQAKTQLVADKVSIEVQVARAAVIAAAERVKQTTEGVALARRMRQAEGERYRKGGGSSKGAGTLLNLTIREEQEAKAASDRVDALTDYYIALADYAAALGLGPAELLSGVATPVKLGPPAQPAAEAAPPANGAEQQQP